MTIKASSSPNPPLSFKDDIEAEFGENPGRTLGQYRRKIHLEFLSLILMDY